MVVTIFPVASLTSKQIAISVRPFCPLHRPEDILSVYQTQKNSIYNASSMDYNSASSMWAGKYRCPSKSGAPSTDSSQHSPKHGSRSIRGTYAARRTSDSVHPRLGQPDLADVAVRQLLVHPAAVRACALVQQRARSRRSQLQLQHVGQRLRGEDLGRRDV